MSLIKKLAGETVIYGLSSIVGRVLNFFLVPMYTRVFSKAEYGEVIDLYAWVGLFIVLFTYRMETGFFRFGTPIADRDRAYSTTSFMLLITTRSLPTASRLGLAMQVSICRMRRIAPLVTMMGLVVIRMISLA